MVGLEADLRIGVRTLELTFELQDPEQQVVESLVPGEWIGWDRADDLWKTTCFEAFFAVPGETGYWELNLSPNRQLWNLYWFDDYRKPQPPTFCMDFRLVKVSASSKSLKAQLHTELSLQTLEFALCAVIRTRYGVSYFALDHAEKPDFHRRAGFLLKRFATAST